MSEHPRAKLLRIIGHGYTGGYIVTDAVDELIDAAFRAGWDGGFAHNDEWADDKDRPDYEKSLAAFKRSRA